MVRLGNPVNDSSPPAITIGQLADKYGEWMEGVVKASRMRPATVYYFRHHLQRFLDAVGGNRPAMALVRHEVEMYKTSWHSLQTVQRLFNWGVEMGAPQGDTYSSI